MADFDLPFNEQTLKQLMLTNPDLAVSLVMDSFKKLPDDIQAEMMEETRQSFAAGNIALSQNTVVQDEPERGVLAPWVAGLRYQQQTTLISAIRGPDGSPKDTLFKRILRNYRGTVLKAAQYGRMLHDREGDSFMTIADSRGPISEWHQLIKLALRQEGDSLNVHYFGHLMHGIQVIGYHHPDASYRQRWNLAYQEFCDYLHLPVETKEVMDERLSDWKGEFYGK